VVIPSFNSGPDVLETVGRVRQAFQMAHLPCEIIVVSDGSTDESVELLEHSADVDLHVWLRTNHGKGGALREGFARSTGEVICFVDADGDLDPIAIPDMAQLIWSDTFDIVYGSKAHPDSNVTMSLLRKVVSYVFRSLVRILFRFDVSDTQTGIKAFNGQLVRSSLQLSSEEGFNLDLELFVIAQTLGYKRFGECAVVLDRRGNSSVNFSTLLAMFFSTLRMYLRFNFTLDYVRTSGKLSSHG
jgi:glycosyltransferase involved in cell wall biosynthesis